MKSVITVVCAAGLALTGLLGTPARAQFKELAQHVPETANTLVMVDAQGIFASAIAKREDWQNDRLKRFTTGLTGVPPHATKMVLAASLDVEVMRPTWEVAIIEMDADISIARIATKVGGTLDKLNSLPAIRLSDDSYVVQLAGKALGMMAPGNRQQVAKWVETSNRPLSPYLQEGVGFAESGAGVIMVLDLHSAFATDDVSAALEEFESTSKSDIDKAELARIIAGVKGAMLGITFGDQPYCRLKFDLSEDATKLADIAKPLILDILALTA